MLNAASYRLNLGYSKDVQYGTLARPISFRDTNGEVSRLKMPFQMDMKFIFVSHMEISFNGADKVKLSFSFHEEKEIDNVMYLKYALWFGEDYIGDFTVDAGSLNKDYDHTPSMNMEELSKEIQDVGHLPEIANSLIALAHDLFLTGRVELRNLSKYERFTVQYAGKLKQLAQIFSILNPNYNFNFQGNMDTLHGKEVQIAKLRMSGDGTKPIVVWSTPKWIRDNDRTVDIRGRYSYEQRLFSFLELYPRHPLLANTAATITRDTQVIPQIRETVKREIATVSFKL